MFACVSLILFVGGNSRISTGWVSPESIVADSVFRLRSQERQITCSLPGLELHASSYRSASLLASLLRAVREVNRVACCRDASVASVQSAKQTGGQRKLGPVRDLNAERPAIVAIAARLCSRRENSTLSLLIKLKILYFLLVSLHAEYTSVTSTLYK